MRIDAHQHFWRYDPGAYAWIGEDMTALKRDFLPEHLEPELRAAGFDGCVTVQVRQCLEETRWLLELADRHPFIKGVVGWADLQSPELGAQLASVSGHPRLVGVRHVVQSEPDERFLLGEAFCRGVAQLAERDLAYDILIYSRQLPVAVEFARRLPGVRLVLDHLAKPEIRRGEIQAWERGLRALAALPHVWCKLSGLVTEADWRAWTPGQLRPYLEVALDAFGPERLMIGSDWPVCTLAAGYARTMGVVLELLAGRPARERDAILGGNAQRFWGLEREERRP
jgi:L-fuconolactonase